MGSKAGIILTGCEKTSDRKVDSAKENVGDATQESTNARATYLAEWQTLKRESEQTIEANEKRIDAFRETRAGPKVNAKYSKEVAVLEQNNRDLKKRSEEFKEERQDEWKSSRRTSRVIGMTCERQ
jgi:hypothetical protein